MNHPMSMYLSGKAFYALVASQDFSFCDSCDMIIVPEEFDEHEEHYNNMLLEFDIQIAEEEAERVV